MTDWRAALDLLEARVRQIPDALVRTAARGVPSLGLAATPIRRIVATGIGSSAAHAALLAHVLRFAGRDAVTTPLSSFLEPTAPRPDDVLVVFSQGLTPNAELALAAPEAWRRLVLVTAVHDDARFRARGIAVHTIEGADEFGTLVRVVGPMTGLFAALQIAAALGGPPAPDVARIVAALDAVRAPDVDPETLEAPLALVTTGLYGEVVANLQYKVMEGMLLPMPPAWDALHLAHGPFQERFRARATFLALTRAGAVAEDDLLDRFATMLDPARHTLLRLRATLPAPLALFEHEALVNALVLGYVRARHVDQSGWPGRDRDQPLYGLRARPEERRLARLVWTEIETRRPRLAIVPLGATEQHGPHLPFATDTLVADALATRLAARVDGALALPALALGCSREHMGFPGTLDLSAPTLVAILADTLRALGHHGVGEAFVFSAHGGNLAALRDALPELRAAAPGIRVTAALDLDDLMRRLHAEAAALGVSPEAAGHHAGELETSIMLALHPELVRADALAPGWIEPTNDPQSLFYPDLRRTSAGGTVGDPRGAAAAHGARYLEVWVDALADALGERKKST